MAGTQPAALNVEDAILPRSIRSQIFITSPQAGLEASATALAPAISPAWRGWRKWSRT